MRAHSDSNAELRFWRPIFYHWNYKPFFSSFRSIANRCLKERESDIRCQQQKIRTSQIRWYSRRTKKILLTATWVEGRRIFCNNEEDRLFEKFGYFLVSLYTVRFFSFLLNFLTSSFRSTPFLFFRVWRISPVSVHLIFTRWFCDIDID